MEQTRTPIDIARQTLKSLVQSKTPPTPDNFRKVYDEIVGVKSEGALQLLVRLLKEAGGESPKFTKLATQLQQAAAKSDWSGVEKHLRQLLPAGAGGTPKWSEVLRELIHEMDVSRPGVSIGKKKDGLERVLANFGADADMLATKLHSLVTSWKSGKAQVEESLTDAEAVPAGKSAASPAAAPVQASATAALWRDMLIKALEFGLLTQLKYLPELEHNAQELLAQAKNAQTEKQVVKLGEALKAFWVKLEMNSDVQSRLHEELLQLLRLLVDNMSELVVDDSWLHGQTTMIRDVISKPLDIETLYDAESSLKELIFKQSKLKHGLMEAKDTLKQMATSFVERLAEMTESTGEFHKKIESYQEQITSTEDIGELNVILDNLMQDTKAMQLDALRAHEHLHQSQVEVQEAEQRILKLTAELHQVSEVAHNDYLTSTLNRRGMDEAFEREFSRADRTGAPISVSLLDIDRFKKLNDALGHEAGDMALVHLAKVVKSALRPTDVLARYGGEEFLIILPETDQAEGIVVMTRVQRELTKSFFMHENKKVLITFSAGVAQRRPQESPGEIIKRADDALYNAKNAGRNRVFGAEPQ
ncbi:MAG: diguanylate cyclase [Methylophilales bacterium RIFCSPHIGHO2_02_FULL_57_10]|nr:MAG: diguanylate cyclase [Methylophilales bacterium RIFCSPHIGHO2_02_FULL_57_10]